MYIYIYIYIYLYIYIYIYIYKCICIYIYKVIRTLRFPPSVNRSKRASASVTDAS